MTFFFHDLIHIILVYLNDLTTRSRKHPQHLDDLRQVFLWCLKYNLRLNPLKCVFCVLAGPLLGFIVSHNGIVVDPMKVQSILNLPPPHTLCQFQSLQGKANFLRQFIPDYATKVHGFLCLLHTNIPFVWDENAQGAFDALQQALNSTPLLSPPNFTKEFILYVSVSKNSITKVLVQEDDARQ